MVTVAPSFTRMVWLAIMEMLLDHLLTLRVAPSLSVTSPSVVSLVTSARVYCPSPPGIRSLSVDITAPLSRERVPLTTKYVFSSSSDVRLLMMEGTMVSVAGSSEVMVLDPVATRFPSTVTLAVLSTMKRPPASMVIVTPSLMTKVPLITSVAPSGMTRSSTTMIVAFVGYTVGSPGLTESLILSV